MQSDEGKKYLEVIKEALENVIKKYLPDPSLPEENLAKALGEFLAEVQYRWGSVGPSAINNFINSYRDRKEKELSGQQILSLMNGSNIERDGSNFAVLGNTRFIVLSRLCPEPKKTLQCLLGIIPNNLCIDEEKEEEKDPVIMQIVPFSRSQQQEGCWLSNIEDPLIVGAIALVVGSAISSATYGLSQAADMEQKKGIFAAISTGSLAALACVGSGIGYFRSKIKPSTKLTEAEINSKILERADEIFERDYRELVDPHLKVLDECYFRYSVVSRIGNGDLEDYELAKTGFTRLQSILNGAEESLVTVFKDNTSRNLFITTVRSFFERYVEMIDLYPERIKTQKERGDGDSWVRFFRGEAREKAEKELEHRLTITRQ